MKRWIKQMADYFDDSLFRRIVKYMYPQYKRQRFGTVKNYQILYKYVFFQKIIVLTLRFFVALF